MNPPLRRSLPRWLLVIPALLIALSHLDPHLLMRPNAFDAAKPRTRHDRSRRPTANDTFGRLDIGRVSDRAVEIGRDHYLDHLPGAYSHALRHVPTRCRRPKSGASNSTETVKPARSATCGSPARGRHSSQR